MAGPNFLGVKMLPPGPHMVSYNATGQGQQRRQEFGPTTSFFLHLASGQVEVRRWDAQQELLVELDEDEVGPACSKSWSTLKEVSCGAVLGCPAGADGDVEQDEVNSAF